MQCKWQGIGSNNATNHRVSNFFEAANQAFQKNQIHYNAIVEHLSQAGFDTQVKKL